LIQVFRIVKGFDLVNKEDFFELDDGGEHALRGHKWKLKVKRNRFAIKEVFLLSESDQFMEPTSDWTHRVQMWIFKLCFCPQSHKLKVNFKAPLL